MTSSAVESPAKTRAALPLGVARKTQTTSAIRVRTETVTVWRWMNSMTVCQVGETGMTCPLHSGQLLPQPAPDCVERTTAPHSATKMLQPTTTQAKRRALLVERRRPGLESVAAVTIRMILRWCKVRRG